MKKIDINKLIGEGTRAGSISREIDEIISVLPALDGAKDINKLSELRDRLGSLLNEWAVLNNVPIIDSDTGSVTDVNGGTFTGGFREEDLSKYADYMLKYGELNSRIAKYEKYILSKRAEKDMEPILTDCSPAKLSEIFLSLQRAGYMQKDSDPVTWLYLFGKSNNPGSGLVLWSKKAPRAFAHLLRTLNGEYYQRNLPLKRAEKYSNRKRLSQSLYDVDIAFNQKISELDKILEPYL
jgi:hypothetical protein